MRITVLTIAVLSLLLMGAMYATSQQFLEEVKPGVNAYLSFATLTNIRLGGDILSDEEIITGATVIQLDAPKVVLCRLKCSRCH